MNTSKIIKGVVSSGRYTVTAPIIKEDYGLYLKIEGVELPSTYEVDFSNSESSGTSVTMIGNSDGVLIPRQFIDTGKDIFAFLYHVGEDFGRTVYKFRIPNKVRPDRTEEQPTPEEQSVIDQAINALNEAVEQTAQDVQTTAQNVSASATNAQTALNASFSASADADMAEQARDDAQTYANNASASATASAQSASQSAINSADAQDSAEEARGYASASAQSASASANSASQALSSAQSASASAQSASGYASSAQASANTASAKAQDASQSASTASQKATESAQSATNASQSAQTAEQAKTASQTAQGLAESARDTAVSAKADAESARDDAVQAKEDAESAVASISGALADKAPVITDTASGAIASFSDGADNLPLKSLIVDINPVQDLHGQESPYHAGGGSNKWDEQWETGRIRWTGQDAEDSDKIRSKGFIPVSEGNVYRVVTSNNLQFFYYDSTQTFVSYEPSSKANQSTITIPTGCAYMRFYTYGSTYGGTYKHDIAINYPSTVTTYSPYENICPISGWTEVEVNHSDADMTNPTTITINLGQTVYGGHLDVLSGVLTVDMAMVDLGTLSWDYVASLACNFRASELIGAKPPATAVVTPNAICSILPVLDYTTVSTLVDGITIIFATSAQAGKVWAHSGTYTDATAFKAAMTGQTLVYELATPIEIQLTPNQINSLLGVNNIWADSGDTEVEYRADTKLFIERLTAPDSADMVADANITSGQYFMVGNTLYKATANIANGSAIIVGTNCIRKSLSEALNEINA